MPNPYINSRFRRFLILLYLISFTSSVWFGSEINLNFFTQQHRFGINNLQVEIGRVVLAESKDASRLVQKGLLPSRCKKTYNVA